MTPPTLPEDVAKAAYKAYGSVTDFKNYQGLPMPAWEDLTPKIKKAWIQASRAVADLTQRGYVPDEWQRE